MRPSTNERREDLLRDALAVMRAEHARALSLDEVARSVATSRRHLQRVFREVHGESFRTSLTDIRLERAAEMLAEPGAPRIREIARAVGYHEPAQFAKAFRRRYGVVPSEFREQARRG